jgi:hypothetical protein
MKTLFSFFKNFRDYFFTLLFIILGLAIIYYAEFFLFKIINLVAGYLIFSDEIYKDYFSKIIIFFIHYFLARLIVLTLLFPAGYFISRLIISMNLIEEYFKDIKLDITYISKNIEKYLRSHESYEKLKNIYDFKLKKIIFFSNLIKKISEDKHLKLNYSKCKNVSENLSKFILKFDEIIMNSNMITLEQELSEFNQLIDNLKKELNFLTTYFPYYNYRKCFGFLNLKFEEHFKPNIKIINYHKNSYGYLLSAENSHSVVLFCNPNGMCSEFYSFATGIFDFYINHNFSVFLWNYEGYGYESGYPNLKNIKTRSEYVMNKLLQMGFKNIGVHGVSMGGYVASHLSGKYSNLSFVIMDRTFSSIRKVIENGFPFGKILNYLYQFLFPSISDMSHEVVKNFHNYKDIPKILLHDPQDSIIPSSASLKKAITDYLYEHIVKPKIFKNQVLFSNQDISKIKSLYFKLMSYCQFLNISENSQNESCDKFLFIKNLFNYFLLYNHSNIKLENIEENFDNYFTEFIRNLFVWGYTSPRVFASKFDNKDLYYNYRVVLILILQFRKSLQELEQYFKEPNNLKEYSFDNLGNKDPHQFNELLKEFHEIFIAKIYNCFIKKYFKSLSEKEGEDQIQDYDYISYKIFVTPELSEVLSKFGNVMTLKCGHNGELSDLEEEALESFLCYIEKSIELKKFK